VIAAEALLERVFGEVFAVRDPMKVSEWAEQHRELVVAARKGRWSNASVPYLVGPMDALNEPHVRRVTFMKFSQGGGTEALYNQLFYIIDQEPGDLLFVYPNDRLAQRVNKRRFLPTLKQCPAAFRHLGVSPRDAQAMELVFDQCVFTFTGSNSQANLESFPYMYGVIDELDRCEETTREQVEERLKTFGGQYKLLMTGSPGLVGVGIDREYFGTIEEDGSRRGGSDRRRFWVPCPSCGVYHLREWELVRWRGGLKATPADVAATAWMVCPARSCGKEITAGQNLWQQLRGRWAREGERVTDLTSDRIEDAGVVVGGEKLPRSDHAGFWVTGEYSLLEANPYGAVAAKFVRNQGERTQNWTNRTRGAPYEPKGESVQVEALKALRGRTGCVYNVLPAWALAVTLAVDVQGNRLYLLFQAWGEKGRDMVPLLAVEVPRTEGLDLVELDAWAAKKFEGVNAGGQAFSLTPRLVAVDTGDFTDECYKAVRRLNLRMPGRVLGVKGEYRGGTDLPHDLSKKVKQEQGVDLLLVNVNWWKPHAMARMKPRHGEESVGGGIDAAPLERGAEVIEAETADTWHWPEGIPTEVLQHFTAEHCVLKRVEGRVKWVWERKASAKRWDFWDCLVYGCAAADQQGVRRLRRAVPAGAVGAGRSEEPQRPAARELERVPASIAAARERGFLRGR
jgi:phage terminase large subunit GpA-like protein